MWSIIVRASNRLEYIDPSRGSDFRDISSDDLEYDAQPESMTVAAFHEIYDDAARLTDNQVAELVTLIKAGETARRQLNSDDVIFDPELAEVTQVGKLARESLVLANLGLVRMMANRRVASVKRSTGEQPDYDDLHQEGYIALYNLAPRFDPSRGFNFSTYAGRSLAQEILAASWESRPGIRVANRVHLDDLAIARAARELIVELQREPTVDELAKRTGLAEQRIEDVRDFLRPAVSLDSPVAVGAPDEHTFFDVIADKPQDLTTSDEGQKSGRNDAALAKLIGLLPPKHQQIIRGLYGLDGIVKSPEELAEEMGIGRESVKRSYERAKARIRALSYMDDAGNLIVSDNRDTPIAS